MGKNSSEAVIVTGDAELDATLRDLPLKYQKKHGRKATREIAKDVLTEFRGIVPEDTRALRDVAVVRAAKFKRGSGRFGHGVHIPREKLIFERAGRGGRIGYDSKRSEPFFYAWSVEFDPDGPKPLRTSLYGMRDRARAKFIASLERLIAEASE